MKITGYWALDVKSRQIYSCVPALLKHECPSLFKKLKKIKNTLPIIANYTNRDLDQTPQIDYGTYIYESSREMKKMQKLYSNILTTWYEVDSKNKAIESK